MINKTSACNPLKSIEMLRSFIILIRYSYHDKIMRHIKDIYLCVIPVCRFVGMDICLTLLFMKTMNKFYIVSVYISYNHQKANVWFTFNLQYTWKRMRDSCNSVSVGTNFQKTYDSLCLLRKC